jgi:hypothetical protein
VSPNNFPTGSKGITAVRVYIDTIPKIRRFEIIFARIHDDDNTIYSYPSDKARPVTSKLLLVVERWIDSIEIKKLENPKQHELEPYDLPIRFQ